MLRLQLLLTIKGHFLLQHHSAILQHRVKIVNGVKFFNCDLFRKALTCSLTHEFSSSNSFNPGASTGVTACYKQAIASMIPVAPVLTAYTTLDSDGSIV